ncbi:glycosyltransferase family 4 protein [Flavobacterium sp. SUN046]|uniref:glycosyltransferase family 4 protein n=1 Tax=Flavobacterium sp. SUN046 TaxID=3002440 RepID=UPI002DBFE038|nr:glycosyltransferase family 4 protein [Flavobacterium sp. SUN046]MEC4050904.1 glycosyltransferase family 4 protein [Flavobacterium sp. SUN046]
MPKVILISQFPLPYQNIGSWTTLYKNYFQRNHLIDIIVCEQPSELFKNVQYSIVKNSFRDRIEIKLTKNKYLSYLKALDKVVKPNQKYIIQIIDNHGIVEPLNDFLEKKGIRKNCYIQFFYHGFPPFHENFAGRKFYEIVDEMIVLTISSYWAHKQYYTILPCKFSVLNNGIDTNVFFSLMEEDKLELKKEFNIADKITFVWCSQDRPKKGLHLLLDAWKRVYATNTNIELWVIGCEAKEEMEGVQYLGRIPNDELALFLQASDVFLFPVLNQEGFGMSLIEALHCGNYAIASGIGGVSEVMAFGVFGTLIPDPHFVNSWVKAIEKYINDRPKAFDLDDEIYSTNRWVSQMNHLIMEAKISLL